MTELLELLNQDLLDPTVRIQVRRVFENNLVDPDSKKLPSRTKSAGDVKSLNEFYTLVSKAIDHYERRSNVSDDKKVVFTEEEPDTASKSETITFSVVSRRPCAFGQGAPLEAKHRNLRPMFREEGEDLTNPGYRSLVVGYWHDNVIRFTCWARSNKVANNRALWFESFMEEYSWWFKLQGLDRVIFLERHADIVTEVSNNKWYGRPLDYFVRTETLKVFQEKTIENIFIDLVVDNEG